MSYLVKDYMTKEINTTNGNTTITEVANVMAADENAEGYVIVLEKGKPVGIVTERDIVNKIVAQNMDPTKTNVSDIMSTPLITIDPDENLLTTSQLMQKNNVRKVVVIKNGIIYGVITAKDISLRFESYVDRTVREIIRWTSLLGG